MSNARWLKYPAAAAALGWGLAYALPPQGVDPGAGFFQQASANPNTTELRAWATPASPPIAVAQSGSRYAYHTLSEAAAAGVNPLGPGVPAVVADVQYEAHKVPFVVVDGNLQSSHTQSSSVTIGIVGLLLTGAFAFWWLLSYRRAIAAG